MIRLAHRMVLTENCNLSCPHCFNADVRKCGVMDADILIRFMRDNPLESSVVKLMGGEPTIHPRIVDITKEACQSYGKVTLFTNGTTMSELVKEPIITKNHFQGLLEYTINGFTFEIDKFSSYKDYVQFITLHFVIPLKNSGKVIKKIEKCMNLYPQVAFLISPDTQVDLFNDHILDQYRTVWVDALTRVIPQLRNREISFDYDHRLPICFYTQKMIDSLHSRGIDEAHVLTITCCGDQYMGLISYNFDIYYCNQTRIKLGSLLDKGGNPKSISDVEKILQAGSNIKTEAIKKISDKCRNCVVVASCKAGCYYNSIIKERSQNE